VRPRKAGRNHHRLSGEEINGSPATLLIRLKSLANHAGRNYYERVKIATTLLDDHEWVESAYKGDAYRAAESLEHEFFHDLCSARSIWELITIFRKFPERAQWEQRKWNLTVLAAACKPDREELNTPRRIKVAEFEEVQKQKADLEFQVKRLDKESTNKENVIVGLQKRVAELERENTHLKGRVDELERVLSKKFAS
jgi:hypothetical protein